MVCAVLEKKKPTSFEARGGKCFQDTQQRIYSEVSQLLSHIVGLFCQSFLSVCDSDMYIVNINC